MSAAEWWKECLSVRSPLTSELMRVKSECIRPRLDVDDTWPNAVARQALYEDYRGWHDRKCNDLYGTVEHYEMYPEDVPKAMPALAFFTVTAPWLYILDKSKQTRSYLIPHQRLYDGRWIMTKTRHNFIRLCSWEAHDAMFRICTGAFGPADHILVSAARDGFTARLEANRAVLKRSMGIDT